MASTDGIAWFKAQFAGKIETATKGGLFDLNMVIAIATQETGEIWERLRKTNVSVDRILELCVGDTIDARSVFPRGKAELLSKSQGAAMFAIARAALVDMAQSIPGYAASVTNPDKFCHGYGIFQYDIQFFLVDPEYFLNRRYIHFDDSLAKCLSELTSAAKRVGYSDRQSLTDMEKCAVAIAYNTGSYRPSLGLKQGYFDGTKYYGENFYDFLKLAESVTAPTSPITTEPPATPPFGQFNYKVISSKPLNLRKAPDLSSASLQRYPLDTRVRVLNQSGPWALVDVNGDGYADGYMWGDYLAPLAA